MEQAGGKISESKNVIIYLHSDQSMYHSYGNSLGQNPTEKNSGCCATNTETLSKKSEKKYDFQLVQEREMSNVKFQKMRGKTKGHSKNKWNIPAPMAEGGQCGRERNVQMQH